MRRDKEIEFYSHSDLFYLFKTGFPIIIVLFLFGYLILVLNSSHGAGKYYFIGFALITMLILLLYGIWVATPERITLNQKGIVIKHWPIKREADWSEVTHIRAVRTMTSRLPFLFVPVIGGLFIIGTQSSLVISTRKWKQTISYEKYPFGDIKTAFVFSVARARATKSRVVVEDELGWMPKGQHPDVTQEEFKRRDFIIIIKIGLVLTILGLLGLILAIFNPHYFGMPSIGIGSLGFILIILGFIGDLVNRRKNTNAIK